MTSFNGIRCLDARENVNLARRHDRFWRNEELGANVKFGEEEEEGGEKY